MVLDFSFYESFDAWAEAVFDYCVVISGQVMSFQ
jgi:hypothetical protein